MTDVYNLSQSEFMELLRTESAAEDNGYDIPLGPVVKRALPTTDTTGPNSIIPDTGICRRYVDCFGPQTEASDESHFAVCLALLSAVVGWHCYASFGESREPCTLYVLLTGTSGVSHRTTTQRNGERIIARADLDVTVQPLGHSSGLGLLEIVCTEDEAEAKLWEDVPPPPFLLSWDEFGSALVKDGWRGDLRAVLMKLASGRSDGTQTGGDSKLKSSRVSVSLLATITNRELSEKIGSGVAHGGFLGRFLMIPERRSGRSIAIPEEPTYEQLDAAMSITEWFGRLDAELDRIGDLGNVYKRLDEEAGQWWRGWYDERKERFANALDDDGGDEDELAEGQFARLQALGVRVAMLLALADWQPGDDLGKTWIELRHVQRAGSLVDLCLERVLELHSQPGQNLKDVWLDRVERRLRKESGQTATWSDIYGRYVKPSKELSEKLELRDLLGLLKRDSHRFSVGGSGNGTRVTLLQRTRKG